jgi:ribosomal protein S27E
VQHVVRDHYETFRVQAATLRDGEGLPRFVEQEFREFLRCGCLAGGFARFRCGDCGLDRLVPFSCMARALCASCGGRLRLIALIEEAAVIDRILRHLGLPTEIPASPPARAPPLPFESGSRRHRRGETELDSCGSSAAHEASDHTRDVRVIG